MTENHITAFFNWWNGAMREPALLTEEGFAQFFTADGRLIVNGNLRATGPAAMAAHYRAIAERCDEVGMVLPVEEAFAAEGRAFVHCRTHVVVNGETAAEEAMAFAVVEDDRIALFRVVSLSV
jgi:hypothetical protein